MPGNINATLFRVAFFYGGLPETAKNCFFFLFKKFIVPSHSIYKQNVENNDAFLVVNQTFENFDSA